MWAPQGPFGPIITEKENPVIEFKSAISTNGKRHLRRAVIKSKTLCGRPIPKTWTHDDGDTSDCAQCDEIANRLLDWENEADDDQFADAYGAGGDA